MPQLVAVPKPRDRPLGASAPPKKDGDVSLGAPAEAERPKAFRECLELVARAHEEELRQQLKALRAENAKLLKRLAETGGSQSAIPGPLSVPSKVASAPLLPGAPQEAASILSDGVLTSVVVPLPLGSPPAHAWTMEVSDGSPSPSPSQQDITEPVTRPLEEPPPLGSPPEAGDLSHSYSEQSACASRAVDEKFPLANIWEQMADSPSAATESVFKRRRQSQVSMESEEELARRAPRFISYPSSPGRLLWDMIGALLILYDLIAIPLESFDPPKNTFTSLASWFTLLFWTLNMPMALQVGYVRDGLTIMEFNKITCHYLKTWFIVDIAVVLPDWVFTLTSLGSEEGSGSGSAGGVRLLRTLRLFRLVRLVRLLKLPHVMRSLSEFIQTEYTNIIANIAKMIVLLLVINHYIGCSWFLVGKSHEGDDTWITYHSFKDVGWGYQYLTSFHWAITQFTPASMHVQPQNPMERAYAIFVVVFALVGFSYVVGSISGSLAQLRSMQEDTYKQFWILRRYLKQNRVPMQLSGRIQRYLEHAWNSQRQTLTLQSSKLFSLLSDQLQAELQYEICLPFLRVHELFDPMSTQCPTTMRRMAWHAIQRTSLAQDDHLFIPGESATHMYILVTGRMEYMKPDEAGDEASSHAFKVQNSEDFIAEPVLWTTAWDHLGALTAITETEVLRIDPQRFADIIHRSPPARTAAVAYGREFVERLNRADERSLSDIVRCERKDLAKARSSRSQSSRKGKSIFQSQRTASAQLNGVVVK